MKVMRFIYELAHKSLLEMILGLFVHQSLDSMVAKIFSAVGIDGKTNHSLRVTGTMRLFTSNVPEKIVQE